MHRLAALLSLAATAAAAAAGAQAPAAPAAVTGWTVVQRLHGCEINRPGHGPRDRATFYRPFRGDIQAHIPARDGALRGLQIGKPSPALIRAGGRSAPVRASLVIAFETRVSSARPEQILLLSMAPEAERAFRALLGTAPSAELLLKGRAAGTAPLPPLAAWVGADRCLARVEQALLTASPPPGPGGVSPPRDRPWPQQAPSRWFASDPSPGEAAVAKAKGDTRVSVSIDRYGYPTGCRVLRSAGNARLDDTACDVIMRRGRFFPALDKEGKATAAVWETAVRWTMSGD